MPTVGNGSITAQKISGVSLSDNLFVDVLFAMKVLPEKGPGFPRGFLCDLEVSHGGIQPQMDADGHRLFQDFGRDRDAER